MFINDVGIRQVERIEEILVYGKMLKGKILKYYEV